MSSVAVNHAVPAAFPQLSAGLRTRLEASLGEQLSATLLLRERAAPLTVPFAIAALDELTGGLPRGALTEIAGPASSGRTGVMHVALAAATRRGEVCALVDASDSFDPASAASAGVDLGRLLWVRCNSAQPAKPRGLQPGASRFAFSGALEQVLKVTDLLLQAGGFGMVILDLGDIPAESVSRIPLTSWFRFRRAVEPTPTVLLLIEQEPCAKTCASLVLRMRGEAVQASQAVQDESVRTAPPNSARWVVNSQPRVPQNPAISHAALLRGMSFRAVVERAWGQRKPPQSVGAQLELRTAI
jgi:recombination protein RecA